MNHIDHETATTIHGELLVWQRGNGGRWVWKTGDEGIVTFFETNGVWKGQRPRALEPLAIAKSLQDCVLQVKKHYILKRAQSHERMAARLRREAQGILR